MRKRPKQPKTSSTLQVWKNWEIRMNKWKADKKAITDRPAAIQKIKAKF